MIITIGREFGSGGKELGRKLAARLGVPCYDKEVIAEVAKRHNMTEDYVDNISLRDLRITFTPTVGKSFDSPIYFNTNASQALVSQQEIIKKLAEEGDCVFIGRSADIILRDKNPLNLFIYASEEAKLARCLENIREGETEKTILKHMRKIDRDRAGTRSILCDNRWGDKESYHLCVNTSGKDIDALIPGLVAYIKAWFAE